MKFKYVNAILPGKRTRVIHSFHVYRRWLISACGRTGSKNRAKDVTKKFRPTCQSCWIRIQKRGRKWADD